MIYDNLILDKSIWSKLKNMQSKNKIPHSLLFYGPEGCGKEAHAIEFASSLNYNSNSDLQKIKIFQHPNIHLITPLVKEKVISKNAGALNALSNRTLEEYIEMKKNKMINPYFKIKFSKASTILINSIRDIKKTIQLNDPNKYNVYLIFEAEKLCHPRNEAGNSLLKILEEPPPNTIFILVTSHKEKIMDTILSRCCDFQFKKPSKNKIFSYLEQNNYSSNSLDLLINLCQYNVSVIIDIIESDINIDDIILNSKKFINDIINNRSNQNYAYDLENLYNKNKSEFLFFMKISIIILSDLNKIINDIDNLKILKQTNKIKNLNYLKCISILEGYYDKLSKNLNPSIGFFAMMIEMKKSLQKYEII